MNLSDKKCRNLPLSQVHTQTEYVLGLMPIVATVMLIIGFSCSILDSQYNRLHMIW